MTIEPSDEVRHAVDEATKLDQYGRPVYDDSDLSKEEMMAASQYSADITPETENAR